ncbi:MAG: MarR family transcriptional regulator [Rhodothermales bacterium]|nr:MarR family transcriptional regulator [Rhodothermales bacterium]
MEESIRNERALKLWVVMNRASRSIEDRLREQVESNGLSFTEFGVLEVLLHRGPLPIGEIGERILLTSGSMTYVVNKLEKRGLIIRRACASDRRVIYAELTRPGKDLIRRVFSEHEQLLARLSEGLSPDEIDEAARLVRKFGLYADNAPVASR